MQTHTAPAAANIAALQAEADRNTSWAHGFINKRACCNVAGVSVASLARKISAGTFPKAIVQEGNFARWDGEAVAKWRADRVANPALLLEDRAKERAHREAQQRSHLEAA